MIWDFSLEEWVFMALIVTAAVCLFVGILYIINKQHILGLWVLLLGVVSVFVIILVPSLSEVADSLPWREAHR